MPYTCRLKKKLIYKKKGKIKGTLSPPVLRTTSLQFQLVEMIYKHRHQYDLATWGASSDSAAHPPIPHFTI